MVLDFGRVRDFTGEVGMAESSEEGLVCFDLEDFEDLTFLRRGEIGKSVGRDGDEEESKLGREEAEVEGETISETEEEM